MRRRERFDTCWRVVVAVSCAFALSACGIANDSVPRDIDPASLEPLSPQP